MTTTTTTTTPKMRKKSKKIKGSSKHTLPEVKKLGIELLSSTTHINNLPILISIIDNPSSPPHFVLESLLSLHSFFTPLLPTIPSSSSKKTLADSHKDAHFIYLTWLRSKFDHLAQSLIDLSVSQSCDPTLREVLLDTIMEFVKVGNGGKFHSLIFHKFILAIVNSGLDIDVLLDLLESKYFKYIDVRYFTYISLEKLARNLEKMKVSDNKSLADDSRSSMVRPVYNVHHLLSRIPLPEGLEETSSEYEMWNGSGIFDKEVDNEKHAEVLKAKNRKQKNHGDGEKKSFTNDYVPTIANVAKKIKLKFTKVWMCFLSLPLPLDVYKEVLVTLHQAVIPYLSNPILLCDFLTRSYDIGGVISVMALSSLYILITQHGLEYPNFYEKLYVLLEPSIFMAKHRGKFFQLLDSCLKSPLLPAYLAAAFAKKLSRLSLSAPPSGGLIIVALIHNLLRRHPSINCLVHRDGNVTVHDDPSERKEAYDHAKDSSASKDVSSIKPGFDQFNEETDPKKTNAMRSSLWEIDTLRHHYCPPVSRFVLSLENDLTVRAKTAEVAIKDFSSGSYATIFGDEIRRRVKQVPLAFYKATPTSLFSESDFGGWTFNLKDDNMIDDKEHNHISAKRQRKEGS
ncbi:nucleolar complex protein 4-like [Heracleum sosnowskyi]|uniref:Nucleolar complex protein 4-like n=1 Tax=Heracleum sosnowskyi TaxID=360622 RepID=A0AAD8M1W7_9APIA|nr:nucleolar complex protein 4-like [Heracleum sosnowskyi]